MDSRNGEEKLRCLKCHQSEMVEERQEDTFRGADGLNRTIIH